MWVATVECTSSDCRAADLFTEAKSSSFQNENQIFDITYGSGEAFGGLGKDTVSIGGFTVQGQVFGESARERREGTPYIPRHEMAIPRNLG